VYHGLIRHWPGSYGKVWLARNVIDTHCAVKIVYRTAFEHARAFDGNPVKGIKVTLDP